MFVYVPICVYQGSKEKIKANLGVVTQPCTFSTGEWESGGPGDQGHPSLNMEFETSLGIYGTLTQKKKLQKKEKSSKIYVLHKFTQLK